MISGGQEPRITKEYNGPKAPLPDHHLIVEPDQALHYLKIRARTDRRPYRFRDVIRVSLSVSNATKKRVKLEFPSAQLYDFVVLSKGTVHWRWSNNKLFASMPVEINLDPGEEFTVSEVVSAGTLSAGPYTLLGIVTATAPYRSRQRFIVLGQVESRHNRRPLEAARRQITAERRIELIHTH